MSHEGIISMWHYIQGYLFTSGEQFASSHRLWIPGSYILLFYSCSTFLCSIVVGGKEQLRKGTWSRNMEKGTSPWVFIMGYFSYPSAVGGNKTFRYKFLRLDDVFYRCIAVLTYDILEAGAIAGVMDDEIRHIPLWHITNFVFSSDWLVRFRLCSCSSLY